MTSIAAGIQRFGRDGLKIADFSLLDKKNPMFRTFRESLDRRRKYLISQGIGHVVKHKDEITLEEENLLWQREIFNSDTAAGLLKVVYFYNMKVFGFRAVNEHENLMQDQYIFGEKHGVRCLEYHGRLSKGVTGALECKATPKVITHYSDKNNPRCIVSLFAKYLRILPESGRFYRKPLPNTADGDIQFSKQVVGKNSLAKIIPDMMREAGIDISNRNITGHSGKVTCATRLYQEGFDEQAIKSRTGHRSDAVHVYKRPSFEMEAAVSRCLQPPLPSPLANQVPIETATTGLAEVPETVDSKDNVLEITVPACVDKIVVTKNGKKIMIEL